MKNRPILLAAMCALIIISACKKESRTPNTPPNTIPPPTLAQSLAGKWFVVKDSIQASDYNTMLPAMRNISYSDADFVVFNADNTGAISSQAAYNALYTNYPAQFVNSITPAVPTMNFNYQVSATDNTLSIPGINLNIGIGYNIVSISAKSLLLYTESTIVSGAHDYVFKQYIYLSK